MRVRPADDRRPPSAVLLAAALLLAVVGGSCDATASGAGSAGTERPTATVPPRRPGAPPVPRDPVPTSSTTTTPSPTSTTTAVPADDDAREPTTVVTSPVDGSTVAAPLTIRGTATGVDRVDRVTITVKDTGTGRYWNPATTSWESAWLWYDADVASTASPSTTWSFDFDPSGTAPTGLYQVTAFGWDGRGHRDPNGSRIRFGGTDPIGDDGWELVWSDEFDGSDLDTGRWKAFAGEYGVPYRDQHYTDRPSNVRVRDGRLVLEAHDEPYGNQGHTSGMVVSNDEDRPAVGASRGNLSWTHGRFEVRARIPDVAGIWPAFWLRPAASTYGSWPRSGEIDVMEYAGPSPNGVTDPRGRFLVANLHTWDPDGGSATGGGGSRQHEGTWWIDDADFFDRFHTWAVEWEPDRFWWYIDGQLFHVADRDWEAPGASFPAPFDQPFFLTLNLQVGGWAGPVDDRALPARFEIDHVRVYR